MKLPDEVLDKAYSIFEEWGPNRRIDRAERLKQEFPALGDGEIKSLLREMKDVSATVWKIAEMGGESKIGKHKIVELLQESHPFLKSKGLTYAFTLVNYYAWHEGYDK
jgi:hypothetical protein